MAGKTEAMKRVCDILDQMQQGQGFLFTGDMGYCLQAPGHREGATLRTDAEVRHAGYGVFLARVGTRDISFCGGGAMTTVRDDDGEYMFSYTALGATQEQLDSMGYDKSFAINKLLEYQRTLLD